MSNRAAFLSTEIRRLAKWSQQALASRLFVSRNYIALIEGEKKTPSVRLLSRLEALYEAANKGNIDELAEQQGSYGVKAGSGEALAVEVRQRFDELIRKAQGRPERLTWLNEQMKAFLPVPHHWEKNKATAPAEVVLNNLIREAREGRQPPGESDQSKAS